MGRSGGLEAQQSGWLRDDVNTDAGTVRITGRYLQPRLDRLWPLIYFAVFFLLVTVLYRIENSTPRTTPSGSSSITSAIISYVGFCLVVGVITFFIVRALRRRVDVMIGFDTIRIGRQLYARNVPIQFSVETHRRAQEGDPGMYARALEVLMQYGERLVTIAEMRLKDKEKAVALALRLQGWFERFDKAMAQAVSQMGGAPRPVGEFGPAPDVR